MITVAASVEEDLLFLILLRVENVVAAIDKKLGGKSNKIFAKIEKR